MVYSGHWNQDFGQPYSPLGTNNTSEQNNTIRTHLTKLVSRGRGPRRLMALIRALNGAAAGGAALVTHRQVSPDIVVGEPAVNGGARVINTVNDVDRVTTAADQTMVQDILDRVFAPNPYPLDRSRNGGGSQLGGFGG
jgi:hypothetical protein